MPLLTLVAALTSWEFAPLVTALLSLLARDRVARTPARAGAAGDLATYNTWLASLDAGRRFTDVDPR